MKPKYEGAKRPAQLDTGSEPGPQKPCSDAGSDVSPGKHREEESKKKRVLPQMGQLHAALKGEGLGMRMVCSVPCDIRSQKEQTVTFLANSEQCSHRKGSPSPGSQITALGWILCEQRKELRLIPAPIPLLQAQGPQQSGEIFQADDLLSLKEFQKIHAVRVT